jgi:hypothetical protein
MRTICITGFNQVNLQPLSDFFQAAGMSSAKSVNREYPMDMRYWHEQVIGVPPHAVVNNPGRLWEQIAGELFIANLSSALWGWTDERSTWCLDFWRDFDPRLHFVLVVSTPQYALMQTLENGDSSHSVDAIMKGWYAYHSELLRFYHQNSQRCVLVDAEGSTKNPGVLIQLCNNQWKLNLQSPSSTLFSNTHQNHNALAQYLAQKIGDGYPDNYHLQKKFEAILSNYGLTGFTNTHHLHSDDLVASYHAVVHQAVEQKSLQQSQIAQLDSQLSLHKQESELLLLQLHQVQEELEQYFLKNQEAQQKIQSMIPSEDHTKLLKSHSELTDTVNHLEKKLADQNKNAADALVQRDSLYAEMQLHKQESELLLLQLHQVQEELEHYFLQYQEAKQQIKVADQRWLRMLQRNPDYWDYDAITLTLDESMVSGNGVALLWNITQLHAAGRVFPQIGFRTIVENENITLGFPSSVATVLKRWPASAANQPEMLLSVVENNACLRDLSTSDWELIPILGKVLAKRLDVPIALQDVAINFDPAPLQLALHNLPTAWNNLPPALRFDAVTLKREQVNPDYEHLWFHFQNLSLGEKRWLDFEFRLSCANVRPTVFGKYPKLEFPQYVGQAPFSQWFDESYDDFGAKLELRFALPEAMDVTVWQAISGNDQDFLKALIERLPAILITLQVAGVRLKRPWEDWITMAYEIQRILDVRLKGFEVVEEVIVPTLAPVVVKEVKKRRVKYINKLNYKE